MTAHGRAPAYLDGTLGPEEELAFLDHVAGCAACEAELHADVQLRDREATLIEAATATSDAPAQTTPATPAEPAAAPRMADIVPLAPRRRRRVLLGAGFGAALAAAAVLLLVIGRRGGDGGPPQLVLAPTRDVPIRLAYGAAARHRDYDVPRGDATSSDRIPAATIDALARRGDCHGEGTAMLLHHEYARAEEIWAGCGAGADLDADRAGLAVLRNRHQDALALADRALAARPAHPVALWNRALALDELDRGAEAAAVFDRLAAGDDGWAAEARRRAAAIRQALPPR